MKIGFHASPWVHFAPPQTLADAVRESAACGWDGIELCNSQAYLYPERIEEIRDLLLARGLALATYYCAQGFLPGFDEGEAMNLARRHIEYNVLCGSRLLAIDGGHKVPGAAEDAHLRRIAEHANRVGAAARDRGLRCVWHQHYGSVFDDYAAFERLMAWTDPELVGFCPDTAQLALSGFDVAGVFRRYLDRIEYVHFKDVEFFSPDGRREPGLRPGGLKAGPGERAKRDYNMLEPGRGVIAFPPLLDLLRSKDYDGWITVDLDYSLTTPLESARYTAGYLREMIEGKK